MRWRADITATGSTQNEPLTLWFICSPLHMHHGSTTFMWNCSSQSCCGYGIASCMNNTNHVRRHFRWPSCFKPCFAMELGMTSLLHECTCIKREHVLYYRTWIKSGYFSYIRMEEISCWARSRTKIWCSGTGVKLLFLLPRIRERERERLGASLVSSHGDRD
jgi:hypothetical protein